MGLLARSLFQVALFAAASVAVFAACSSDKSSGNAAKSGSSGAASTNAEPLFRAVQADLVATCGGPNGTCHVSGTFQSAPTWLGGPDPYVTIKKYKGVLPATKDVGDSILLTQVRHAGPTLSDGPNDLFGRVADWLKAEVPGPPLPSTGPFSVASGFNSISLATVAPGLDNAHLTFLATDLGGTLQLSAIQLRAPNDANVTVTSPFFVVLPRSGKVKPDPDSNGFQGPLVVNAGANADFYAGTMVLLQWDATGRLKLAFESVTTAPGQATAIGCTALDLFKSSALPAMNMPVDVRAMEFADAGDPDNPTDLGQSSCIGCHGAQDPAPGPAVNAMDLRAVTTDPATACAQAKLWVNVKDKANSVILLNPVGRANQVHPMVPVTDSDPIVTGIKAWVDAEQ